MEDKQAKKIRDRSGGEVSFIYPNTHEFVRGMVRQSENNYKADNFYFRGGFKKLMELEVKIGNLLGLPEGHLALTTSGMSAVVTGLEIASLTTGNVIIHGNTEYGQIDDYMEIDLRQRGVIPIKVNFGDFKQFEEVLKKHGDKIKVVFAETVGNGPAMPVLDLEKFFSLTLLKKIDPLIILDNTLPTNSIIPLASILKKSALKIIGLESATKFYLFNQDLGGILFTYHEEVFQKLLGKRRKTGVTPGPSLVKTFERYIPATKEEFDRDNKKTVANTLILAKAANSASGNGNKFDIHYPNLPLHQNYKYAKATYPNGIAIAFFINAPKNSPLTSEEIFYKLEEHGGFEGMIVAESFGFARTSVYYSTRYGTYVRIAGGLESEDEVNKFGERLKNALSKL